MRMVLALSAIIQSISTLTGSRADPINWAIGSLGILVGLALTAGFLTPISGAVASVGSLVAGASWLLTSSENNYDKAIADFYLFVISIAITLLGPGAFSLDARLFGRREIIIPENSRTRLP
jgi:uncharacterized membrane protein YphA (DoxX/SURF4 family)